MTYIIGVVAQKGGVGKSTIARMLAREIEAADGYRAKIADMDTSQVTNLNWSKRRANNGYEPAIDVQSFSSVPQAMKSADRADIFIFDGAPHTSKVTMEIARVSDLVVIPTGATRDDLDPAINLARELEEQGTERHKIVFVLSRLGKAGGLEEANARKFIERDGWHCLKNIVEERRAYKNAGDIGHSLTEASHGLGQKAEATAQEILDCLAE
ncbi:MAG: ParA family protein [Granulosicoccaceae bacterium]